MLVRNEANHCPSHFDASLPNPEKQALEEGSDEIDDEEGGKEGVEDFGASKKETVITYKAGNPQAPLLASTSSCSSTCRSITHKLVT